jgi:hypothetical protein
MDIETGKSYEQEHYDLRELTQTELVKAFYHFSAANDHFGMGRVLEETAYIDDQMHTERLEMLRVFALYGDDEEEGGR